MNQEVLYIDFTVIMMLLLPERQELLRLALANQIMHYLFPLPYEDPEVSVTVVIPNGHTSGNAAETAKDIYDLYFNLENEENLVAKEAILPENNIAAFSD